jgi:hypothetical protein
VYVQLLTADSCVFARLWIAVRREAHAINAVDCFICYATGSYSTRTLMYLNIAVSAAAAAAAAAKAVSSCMCAHGGALLLLLLCCSRRLVMCMYRVLAVHKIAVYAHTRSVCLLSLLDRELHLVCELLMNFWLLLKRCAV